MARRGFFTFGIGSAAAAACVGILQKKGGVHISVDVEPRRLGGETAAQALARLRADTAAENEDDGENQSD